MTQLEQWQQKYPQAPCWAFGDSPALADELVALVIAGRKTATCGSFTAFESDDARPYVGSYNILLNGRGEAAAVIRTVNMQLIRFSAVTAELARKEGEGDLSLDYWRNEHQRFFTREGSFSPDMELVFEEFILVECA